jgi:hypothetical protein
MRKFLAATALIGLVVLGACARASSDADKMQPGTPVTVTMRDGSIVSGRLVETKADAVVVDPFEGGEWRTLPRNQISSLTAQPPAAGQAQPAAQAPPAGQIGSATPQAAPVPSNRAEPSGGRPRANASPAPAAPPEPAFREVTIPAETLLHVRLDTKVASDTSRVEDRVSASVSKPIVIDGLEAVPAGSTLKGVVTQAKPSGRVKGRAEIAFRFDVLAVSGGDEQRVQTRTVAVEAPSTTKKDALKIGAPAVGGAILGGILGGKKGAAIGGAVGGGAGTAVVLGTPGEEVRLPAGSAVTVKLLEPVTVRVAVVR